jgi:hypothetical protein
MDRGGQNGLDPLQNASLVQLTSSPGLHRVPAGAKEFGGHAVLDPVQLSGTSQVATAARQTAPAPRRPSAGHAPLEPVQFSG